MWGLPMFDIRDAAAVMMELADCRKVHGGLYIRISGFDSTAGWESVKLSFIVNRPQEEPGFHLARQEAGGRNLHYTTHAYATDLPEGQRYNGRLANSSKNFR
jgi:ribulose-bisphosphate carboxylase small chain